MSQLSFTMPDGSIESVDVTALLNAGYAGRNQAKLHRTSPSWQPWAYPPLLPPRALPDLAVSGPADRSGLRATRSDLRRSRVGDDHHRQRRIDHRRVRPHRSRPRGAQRWSKNAAPDVLGSKAWRLSDIADRLDDIALEAWVGHGDTLELIQQGTLGDLLAPRYWLDVLTERGDARPGTVLISGTISMLHGVNQFADTWKVAMTDPATQDVIGVEYQTVRMPESIG